MRRSDDGRPSFDTASSVEDGRPGVARAARASGGRQPAGSARRRACGVPGGRGRRHAWRCHGGDVRCARDGRPRPRVRPHLRLLRGCREWRLHRGGPSFARGDDLRGERKPSVHRRAPTGPRPARGRPRARLRRAARTQATAVPRRTRERPGLPGARRVAAARPTAGARRPAGPRRDAQGCPRKLFGAAAERRAPAVSRRATRRRRIPGVRAVPLGAARGCDPRARSALSRRRLPATAIPKASGARHATRMSGARHAAAGAATALQPGGRRARGPGVEPPRPAARDPGRGPARMSAG